MKLVLQNMSSGETELVTAPTPTVRAGEVLIESSASLISAGTERMLVDFGKANLLNKARQQPDKVKMVLDKVQTDGLLTTVDSVRSKLGEPLPLGYCNVGVVSKIGAGVDSFKVGDRVASNGAHSDIVSVPKNLCAKIPDNVSDEDAAFTVVASIALQGIRLSEPTLGEAFVVTGVGLIGLLTVQLLKAHGCRVLAIDFDEQKLKLAKSFGAEICDLGSGEDPVVVATAFSRGVGVDGVIITASTQTSDPVIQAAKMSRKRGRIILVGVTGLELNRADFYEKELSFQVSCSYGPGRYDAQYEQGGQDYPIGFVRWTEQRNFIAVLDMLSSGQLKVNPLITHRFDFEYAPEAYDMLVQDKSILGVLLEYSSESSLRHCSTLKLDHKNVEFEAGRPIIGFVGAGNYASRMLIPAFKKAGAQFHTIATSGGVSGVVHGKKANFSNATTDTLGMINNPNINTIAIATRHNSHAFFVSEALKAGKNVFVEKPLAINLNELEGVQRVYQEALSIGNTPRLMVGFNRRFSPQVQKIKSLIAPIKEPKSFVMVMNAGVIPVDHWSQDVETGGGRIIGEACHFIDLMRFLADSEIVTVQCQKLGTTPILDVTEDKAAIILGFADGSFGTIHYLANGSASFPKERIEVFVAGRVLQLDNFRSLKGFGWPGFKKMNLWRQDKGQNFCAAAFLDAIEKGVESPISADELFEVAKVTINIAEQLRSQV